MIRNYESMTQKAESNSRLPYGDKEKIYKSANLFIKKVNIEISTKQNLTSRSLSHIISLYISKF